MKVHCKAVAEPDHRKVWEKKLQHICRGLHKKLQANIKKSKKNYPIYKDLSKSKSKNRQLPRLVGP